MVRRWIPVFGVLFVVVFGVVWIKHSFVKEVSSIKLECADDSCLFKEKSFEKKSDLRKFRQAMNQADKIKGDIDLAPMFRMYVIYKDGTQKKYVLNLNEEYKGKAILVNVEKGDSYFISKSQADLLRPIIFGY